MRSDRQKANKLEEIVESGQPDVAINAPIAASEFVGKKKSRRRAHKVAAKRSCEWIADGNASEI
jgi:hypothetical protein